MQFRALALALAHASVALAVCGAGQIGVGTGQLCQLTSVTQSGAAGYFLSRCKTPSSIH